MSKTNKHPCIVYTLEREIIGDRLLHTLVLTDPNFHEELDDCDWAGADFQLGVEESDNGSLPDAPGLWIADFRIDGDPEFQQYQLVQESPWRKLSSVEAFRFSQGWSVADLLKP